MQKHDSVLEIPRTLVALTGDETLMDGITISPEQSTYTSKTDAEIKQLAQDVIAGNVFGTWNLRDISDARMVFMVLSFMTSVDLKEIQRDGVVHFFEHMSKAGPRSVNGYPCFFSACYLDQNDTERMVAIIEKIENAMEQI